MIHYLIRKKSGFLFAAAEGTSKAPSSEPEPKSEPASEPESGNLTF